MNLKKKSRALPLLAAMLLICTLFFGCASTGETVSASSEMDFTFSDRELDTTYDEASATKITFSGSSASVSGDGATAGTDNVVTITAEGTYIVSGTAAAGQLVVNGADTDKIQIVLDGASVTCADSAALYIKQADKVFVTLAEGTANTLADGAARGSTEEETKVDGVIYSKADLAINGSGTLTVNGSYKHGIVSKDDLVITGGNISVAAANGQGLYGQDCVKIKDGTFQLETGGDGIQSDNTENTARGFVYIAGGTFTIAAEEGDGIQAETTLRVDGGSFTIVTAGGSAKAPAHEESGGMGGGGFGGSRGDWHTSGGAMNVSRGAVTSGGGFQKPQQMTSGPATAAPKTTGQSIRSTGSAVSSGAAVAADDAENTVSTKGLKAGKELLIKGGTFAVDTVDDGLHSNGNLTVENGTITVATGDDGMHADGALTITGGTIDVTKSYEGLEGKSITISGGDIDVTSSDDGMNAAGGSDGESMGARPGEDSFSTEDSEIYIAIKGGTVVVNAGGDGIDSNGDLKLSGGTVTVYGPENSGNGALDYNGSAQITGGVFMGTGNSGMAQGFSTNSTQYSLLYCLSENAAAGTKVTIKDSSGNVVASWTAEKQFNAVQYSSSQLKEGETYTITAGTASGTITLDSISVSNGGGMGGMGGHGGGGNAGGGRGGMQPPEMEKGAAPPAAPGTAN